METTAQDVLHNQGKTTKLVWSRATHRRLQKIEACTALDSWSEEKLRSTMHYQAGNDPKRNWIGGHYTGRRLSVSRHWTEKSGKNGLLGVLITGRNNERLRQGKYRTVTLHIIYIIPVSCWVMMMMMMATIMIDETRPVSYYLHHHQPE